MAKIIIKNFRAIDYAEIEIKPFTVIIGEQASGKSTISKLVYFFRTFVTDYAFISSEYWLQKFVENRELKFEEIDFENARVSIESLIKNKLRKRFHEFFDSTNYEVFEISYTEPTFSIIIKPDNKISVAVDFPLNPITLGMVKKTFLNKKGVVDSIDIKIIPKDLWMDSLSRSIKNFRRTSDINEIFIPASRSLITTILPASQSKFIAEIDKRTEDNQIDYFVKTFLEDIDYFKRNYFFGKSLDEVIDEFELKTGKENPQAKKLRDKIKTILKADYQNGSSGEQLMDKRFLKPVSLDKASSGQQEVVWILLTLLSLVLEDNKSFVVIEEPEAHLYPKTQAQVVEYIAQFFNAKEGNEMIITTHSPYILTVLNNLLLAKQISVKTHDVENQAIAESIDPQAWLDIDKFSAYYVGRNEQGQFIKSIINPETGLISVNALDDASDDIMDTFDNLMDIYKSAAV